MSWVYVERRVAVMKQKSGSVQDFQRLPAIADVGEYQPLYQISCVLLEHSV